KGAKGGELAMKPAVALVPVLHVQGTQRLLVACRYGNADDGLQVHLVNAVKTSHALVVTGARAHEGFPRLYHALRNRARKFQVLRITWPGTRRIYLERSVRFAQDHAPPLSAQEFHCVLYHPRR